MNWFDDQDFFHIFILIVQLINSHIINNMSKQGINKTQSNTVDLLKKHLLTQAQQFNIQTYINRKNNYHHLKQSQTQELAEINRRVTTQLQDQISQKQINKINQQNLLKQQYLSQINARDQRRKLRKFEDMADAQALKEYQLKFQHQRQYQLNRIIASKAYKSSVNSVDSRNDTRNSNVMGKGQQHQLIREDYKDYLKRQIQRKQSQKQRSREDQLKVEKMQIEKYREKYAQEIDRIKLEARKRQLQFRKELETQIHSKSKYY